MILFKMTLDGLGFVVLKEGLKYLFFEQFDLSKYFMAYLYDHYIGFATNLNNYWII